MGINLAGIHFHCGTGKYGADFGDAVDLARKCIEIGRTLGHKMEIMDVGGGLHSDNINVNIL